MIEDDEKYFRTQAIEAQKQADRARSDVDRGNWLRIAQSWMSLIKGRTLTAKETFDDASQKQGTNQDVSKKWQ
jgi:hypothetical protein